MATLPASEMSQPATMEDTCPWCGQPIPHEKFIDIKARSGERAARTRDLERRLRDEQDAVLAQVQAAAELQIKKANKLFEAQAAEARARPMQQSKRPTSRFSRGPRGSRRRADEVADCARGGQRGDSPAFEQTRTSGWPINERLTTAFSKPGCGAARRAGESERSRRSTPRSPRRSRPPEARDQAHTAAASGRTKCGERAR